MNSQYNLVDVDVDGCRILFVVVQRAPLCSSMEAQQNGGAKAFVEGFGISRALITRATHKPANGVDHDMLMK